jgi:hypothetical protein
VIGERDERLRIIRTVRDRALEVRERIHQFISSMGGVRLSHYSFDNVK